MASWGLRLRALMSERTEAVFAGLVVLALIGGGVTYATHVEPGTTNERVVVSSWQPTGEFSHGATVQRPNSVFPVGTELENRSVYFSQITPVLDGDYVFTYRASDRGALNATVRLELVVRGVKEEEGKTTVLWERVESLGDARTATLSPGERLNAPFSVDVEAVENRTERIDDELGGTPGTVETDVRATVDLAGTVNGQRVDDREVHTLSLTPDGSVYEVVEGETAGEPREATRSVAGVQTYGPLRAGGGPLLLFVGLLGIAGLALAQRRGVLDFDDRERAWLAYEEERTEFDEWITAIALPPEAFDRPRATAQSLADLVDVAIDTDSAVVESPVDGNYYVVHGEFIYAYSPPAHPAEVAGSPAVDAPAEPPGRSDGAKPSDDRIRQVANGENADLEGGSAPDEGFVAEEVDDQKDRRSNGEQ